MGDRFNTWAGWLLFAGIIALGGGIVSSELFHQERPEEMAYAIEGVEAEGEGGADAGPSFATLMAHADAAAGEKVYGKCATCHTINQGGANGIGPNLYGVVGEGVGEGKAGFAFSDALKKVGGTWTFDQLDKWLKSPREFAPGTKMTFAGLGNPQDRANLIAYLNAQGSNLPLPAPEAEPATAGNAAAPADAANAASVEAPARDATQLAHKK